MKNYYLFLFIIIAISCSDDDSRQEPQEVFIQSNTQVRGSWKLESIIRYDISDDPKKEVSTSCQIKYGRYQFTLSNGLTKQEGTLNTDDRCIALKYSYYELQVSNGFKIINCDRNYQHSYIASIIGGKLNLTLVSRGPIGNLSSVSSEDMVTEIYRKIN